MKYYIAQKSNYYGPSTKYAWWNQTEPNSNIDDAEQYDSLSEAEQVLNNLNKETYHLQNGEYSRPEYLVLNENQAQKLESYINPDCEMSMDWDHAADPKNPTEAEIATAYAVYADKGWEKAEFASKTKKIEYQVNLAKKIQGTWFYDWDNRLTSYHKTKGEAEAAAEKKNERLVKRLASSHGMDVEEFESSRPPNWAEEYYHVIESEVRE
jgi:hypothetical protein